MTHSYRVHFFHWIWSTQGRRQWIVSDVQQRLYSYVGGIVRNYEGSLIEIGGMPDHVHLLIKLNNLDIFSSLIRDVKAHSSLWVHKNFPSLKILPGGICILFCKLFWTSRSARLYSNSRKTSSNNVLRRGVFKILKSPQDQI